MPISCICINLNHTITVLAINMYGVRGRRQESSRYIWSVGQFLLENGNDYCHTEFLLTMSIICMSVSPNFTITLLVALNTGLTLWS